jgi:hypothetical protein
MTAPPYLAHDPCAYCGGRIVEPWRSVVGADHIVPLSVGGGDDWTNLTACCKSCNSSKGADPLLLALLRMQRTIGYRLRQPPPRRPQRPPATPTQRPPVGSPTIRRWLARQGREVAPWPEETRARG